MARMILEMLVIVILVATTILIMAHKTKFLVLFKKKKKPDDIEELKQAVVRCKEMQKGYYSQKCKMDLKRLEIWLCELLEIKEKV